MLNFWLVSVAFLTNAFVAGITDQSYAAALGVAIAGAVVSLCFHRLERRTRLLVRLGEAPLASLQQHLAKRTGIADLEIVVAADANMERFTSYSVVIRTLEWFAIAAFSVAAVLTAAIWWTS